MALLRKTLMLSLSATLFLSACGGGNSGGNNRVQIPPPAGNPPPGAIIPPPGTGIIFTNLPTLEIIPEIEPNDSMASATPLPITDTPLAADIVGGIGLIQSGLDTYDYYSITANYSREHFVQLCPDVCALGSASGNIDVDVAYFDILDSAGNIVASTAGDPASNNFISVTLDAGVIYYIAVTAVNTPSSFAIYGINLIDADEG